MKYYHPIKKDVFSHLIIGIGYDHMQERANFFNMFLKKFLLQIYYTPHA